MEKIYNNLSIENLMKTEWFNQFDRNQIIEIRWGLSENLDVSIYAKPEFDGGANESDFRRIKEKLRCFYLC